MGDLLKDPKNGTLQSDPHYYVGETRGLLRGSIFWILLGGLSSRQLRSQPHDAVTHPGHNKIVRGSVYGFQLEVKTGQHLIVWGVSERIRT